MSTPTSQSSSHISIVTPFYNGTKWLASLLNTIERQTLLPDELLIVDDCSTEVEFERLLKVTSGRSYIRVLKTATNAGPARARNLGIENVTSRFVAFLDVDDIWHPDKLKTQLGFMLKNKKAFCYHDYAHMSADGMTMGKRIFGPDRLDFATHHKRRGTGGCLSVVIDLQTLPWFRFPDVDKRFPEDFLAWSEILRRGENGTRCPELLGLYRIHEGNRSGNKLKVILSVLETYLAIEKIPFGKAVYWWLIYVANTSAQYLQGRVELPIDQSVWHGKNSSFG